MTNIQKANSLAISYRLKIDPRLPPRFLNRMKKSCSESFVFDEETSNCGSFDLDANPDHSFDFSDDEVDANHADQDSSLKVYTQVCERYKRIPFSCIRRGLQGTKMSCKFVHLHQLDIRAICCALCESWKVEYIDFEQNDIGPLGACLFSNIISSTSYITHIRLANNKLRSEGAKLICEAVQNNRTVIMLDLSGNEFVEGDGVYFQKLIEESDSLQQLYIAHNELMQQGVEAIAKALTYSSTLKVLDLKWNHIRTKGGRAIGKAIRHNASLENLDLSWNGLHIEGSEAIARSLPKNDTLLELNISNNRLDEKCFALILQGLKGNSVLQQLRAANNHLTSKGATTIITELMQQTDSSLKLLDLGNLEVTDSFVNKYNELRTTRDIEVLYGQMRQEDRVPLLELKESADEALLKCNPLIVIMEFIRLKNLRLIDFFKTIDRDRDNKISVEELHEGLAQFNVPLGKTELRAAINKIDKSYNGHFEFLQFMEANRMHKAMVRNLSEENKDMANTQVGRVANLLGEVLKKVPKGRRLSQDVIMPGTGNGDIQKAINIRRHSEPIPPGLNDKKAAVPLRRNSVVIPEEEVSGALSKIKMNRRNSITGNL